jgi:purine-binding chemotaxis protein CheW
MDTAVNQIPLEEAGDLQQKIDFKMVTFRLGGKDYGIDIMKVKEILKGNNFTFVPNTLPYVAGVYNLRGNIIPIIDLRKMFYLPGDVKKHKAQEEVIILRLVDDLILGIIVDSINKVQGIVSNTIQPPHPLFVDINIKYIAGVVEHEKHLFIILDVERIFSKTAEPFEQVQPPGEKKNKGGLKKVAVQEVNYNFVVETLRTFKSFYVSDLNRKWVETRFKEWKTFRENENKSIQLADPEDAGQYLDNYFSLYTNRLWGADYKENLLKLIPDNPEGMFNVWNPGCGRGFESYSIASIIRIKYPEASFKIWSSDNDLLSISAAPNLQLNRNEIPDYFFDAQLIVEQDKGCKFIDAIKANIIFEYHDLTHKTELPKLDLIVARDILSFFSLSLQDYLLADFREHLKDGGILILGINEEISENGWYRLEEGNIIAYKKDKT